MAAYQASFYSSSSGSSGQSGSSGIVNQVASDLLSLASGSQAAGAGGASYSVQYSSSGSNAASHSQGASLSLGSGASQGVSLSLGSGSGASQGVSLSLGSGASQGVSSFSLGSGAGAGNAQVTSFEVSSSSSGSAASAVFLSQIEQAILRSAAAPIESNESEEITVLGQRGVWLNRAEVVNWRGQIPITEYLINEDANPEIINRRVSQSLEYVQELAIKYLRPPEPPVPGEIVIVQEASTNIAPAPPLIIRQAPARPATPEPLVIREAPPEAPRAVGRKVITISGRRIPPPPRKVIIERLAALPAKPQSVLIERWLPYGQVKRRVIFQNNAGAEVVAVKPRNVIIQWEAPQVNIRKEIKYLGVERVDNVAEYVRLYGASLVLSRNLPQFVLDIKTPDGIVLAANAQANNVLELEGDLQAFRLVDLDREGLAEYRAQLQRLGISFVAGGASGASFSLGASGASSASGASGASFSLSSGSAGAGASSGAVEVRGSQAEALLNQIFSSDFANLQSFNQSDARNYVLRIGSRLNRQFDENQLNQLLQQLERDASGNYSVVSFRRALNSFVL